jgi:hypothetical protein
MEYGTIVRSQNGWTGVIVERPNHWAKLNNRSPSVVYVRWKEREEMMKLKDRDNFVIKDPVTSARIETLTIIS